MDERRRPMVKLLGFPIYIDLSWVLVVLLIAWSLASAAFPTELPYLSPAVHWWMGITGALGLFVCILLHEMAHAVVARRYGVEIGGITLWMFGGVAEMRGEPPSPKAELLIAAAGPLMSVALGLLFALTIPVARTLGGPVPAVVCGYLAWGNLVLALFNMLPAFPLDGGRVLRAALWAYRRDLLWGTRVSARIGEGFGYLLVALGIFAAFSGSLVTAVWFVLLGFLLRGAARRSYQEVVTQRVLEDVRVGRFMTTDVVTVPSDMPLERFVDEVVYRHHHRVYPVVDQGNLVGSMRTRDLARLGRAEWAGKRVLDVMVPINDETSIDIRADALTALQRMRGSAHSRLLVVDGKRLAGVLSLKDLLDHLALRAELELGEEGGPGRPVPHAA